MLAFPIAFNVTEGRPLKRNVRDPDSATWKTCYLQKTAEALLLSTSSIAFIRRLHTIVLSFWTQISVNIMFDIGFYPAVDIMLSSWRHPNRRFWSSPARVCVCMCITYGRFGRTVSYINKNTPAYSSSRLTLTR